MKNYASGYALLALFKTFGWLVIFVSIICAIVLFASAPREMAWIGTVVGVLGGLLGLMMIGLSELGAAIIDGSDAQQTLLKEFKAFASEKNRVPRDEAGSSILRAPATNSISQKKSREFQMLSYSQFEEGEQLYYGKRIKKVEKGFEVVGREGTF